MKFEHTEVWGFEHAVRGMRNAMESWHKSDSKVGENGFEIGENDMWLLKHLCKAGSSDRKALRQIMVSVDVTAPMYWFSEFDTYKVGTVANSTSKMHKLASTPITADCFEMDSVDPDVAENLAQICEEYRQMYNRTKDKKLWRALVQILPESWLQTRTWTANYEVIRNMYHQRKFHKLKEWSTDFCGWVKTLPYAEELIIGDDE